MATVSDALRACLELSKTPANADLVDKWHDGMETQVNVGVDGGESVAGRKSAYTDGLNTWYPLRMPRDADSEPWFDDYTLGFSPRQHAEGIGCTGLDWKSRRSRWVAFDFDGVAGHAKGISAAELARVKDAAAQLLYVQVRKSTGGGGLHLYVYFDAAGVPCENHTVHQRAGALRAGEDVPRLRIHF